MMLLLALLLLLSLVKSNDLNVQLRTARLVLKSNPNLRGDIKKIIGTVTRKNVAIFDAETENECVALLQSTGLIEWIYEEMMERGRDETKEGVMKTVIVMVGQQMCYEEEQKFKETKRRFDALSEHIRNEIEKMVLQQGKERHAWDAPMYSMCISSMSDGLHDLHLKIASAYPAVAELDRIDKLLKLFGLRNCDAHFIHKHDL